MSWERHGRSIRVWSNSFMRFKSVVEDYGNFDVGVKNAILKAASSVVSIITHTGRKVVFIGSGTIIECEEQDDNFFGTILTSATLLRGPVGGTSVPCNLEVAVGGPLVNCNGEVIGINFFACPFNAFLPMNVASKCLEHMKKKRQVPRPCLGVGFTNLYNANLDILDKLKRKFPHVVKGVIVEEVHKTRSTSSNMERNKVGKKRSIKSRMKRIKRKQMSLASLAGLCAGDVIVRCGENAVGSHLEFTEALWDKEGKPVKLVVLRPSVGKQLNLTVTVKTSPQENRWPVPENGDSIILSFPYHL